VEQKQKQAERATERVTSRAANGERQTKSTVKRVCRVGCGEQGQQLRG